MLEKIKAFFEKYRGKIGMIIILSALLFCILKFADDSEVQEGDAIDLSKAAIENPVTAEEYTA